MQYEFISAWIKMSLTYYLSNEQIYDGEFSSVWAYFGKGCPDERRDLGYIGQQK